MMIYFKKKYECCSDILKLSAMIFVWIEVTRDDSPVTEPETRNGKKDFRHS